MGQRYYVDPNRIEALARVPISSSQVRMMKDTRDRNIEDVERVNNRIETDGLNGDGPGRHGRR